MLHRLACFRDDVVFVILIYQRWIYRIDPNRENEFGTPSSCFPLSPPEYADRERISRKQVKN